MLASLWEYLVDSVSAWRLLTVGTWTLNFLLYYGIGNLFLVPDLTRWPAWFYSYRIQKGPGNCIISLF